MKLGVLISGRGSNLQALIDATRTRDFPAEIALVIANAAGVEGLARAERVGIATQAIDHKAFGSRAAFEDALHAALTDAGVELVCLAGFMRILTEGFVARWHDRLINIHPSLLPAFPGLDTHQRALDAGVRFTGCTVHFVRAGVDEGPIIAQSAVPVHPEDTADSLAARVLVEEHRIYPLAVRLIAEGRVRIEDARVAVDGAETPDGSMSNPRA